MYKPDKSHKAEKAFKALNFVIVPGAVQKCRGSFTNKENNKPIAFNMSSQTSSSGVSSPIISKKFSLPQSSAELRYA